MKQPRKNGQFASIPLQQRFWEKVDRAGECWNWLGCKDHAGYGQIRLDGKLMLAHRASWLLHHDSIPDDLFVCHHCDNPGCVNPGHLFIGTNRDNMQDASRKGRLHNQNVPRGEVIVSPVLTEAQVIAIRGVYSAGNVTQRSLATEYGVSCSTIRDILKRRTWRHVSN